MREALIGLGSIACWIAGVLAWECLAAEEPAEAPDIERPPAGRPWMVVCLSSFNNLHDRLDATLLAADRLELAEVLAARLQQLRNLKGIDKTRPLGYVQFWPPATSLWPEEVLFLPDSESEELVRTISLGIVDYECIDDQHYTLQRPGSTYHVIFRKGYAWLGDRPDTLVKCAQMSNEWIPLLVGQDDIGILYDFKQIPLAERLAAASGWRASWDPWLQQRDDEKITEYEFRKRWTEPVIQLISWAIGQSEQLIVRVRFDEDLSACVLDFRLHPETGSVWSEWLKNWRPQASTWQNLLDDKTALSAGVITAWPLKPQTEEAVRSPLEQKIGTPSGQVAWQVFGEHLGVRCCVLALGNNPANSLRNDSQNSEDDESSSSGLPPLSLIPVPDVQPWLRRWISGNPEAWRVESLSSTWWGFGSPDLARGHLNRAWQAAHRPVEKTRVPRLVSARVPLRLLLTALPDLDPLWVEFQLQRRDDRVEFSVWPQQGDLRARVTIPSGGLRIIGGILAHRLQLEQFRLQMEIPQP
ncbi:MAG: hypothetical protein KatS3mg113_0789 [Planctomycetaceae bacterium]|nr:MAG: hypothetical protein KatS3mg113_0789 [Planctomycetaceae bacterium]